MSKVIGIDFGTTDSSVGVYINDKVTIIPNEKGNKSTPSVVAFKEDGQILIGDDALRQQTTNASRTISSVKRLLGVESVAITIDAKRYSPEEICAKILFQLKQDAQHYLNETITDAVISVPAYFDNLQRKAMLNAGKIAGLNVRRIISESSATALAYGNSCKCNDGTNILVYDLGGGTFDASVVEITDNTYQVLATNGNTQLGGDDFDNLILKYLIASFKASHSVDLQKDEAVVSRLKNAAESAKIALSSATATEINLPFITRTEAGPQHLVVKLTRNKFESMIQDLVEETIKHVQIVLNEANLNKNDIDEIVMAGASTYIPCVAKALSNYFGAKACNTTLDVDEAITVGAAIQGAIRNGEISGTLILDVVPMSIGIETLGGVMTKIIEKGTTLPVKKSQVFSTAEDNQAVVSISVGQGEHEFAKDNKSLGLFELGDIAPAPKGIPQIEVTFDVDANGIFDVSSVDKTTAKEQTVSVSGSTELSQEDIQAKKAQNEQEQKAAYQEAPSDMSEMKKRLEREKETAIEYANEKFARDMIPVLDALDGAMSSMSAEGTSPKLQEGIALTHKSFLQQLNKHGVSMVPHDEPFDPSIHNAVQAIDSPYVESGQIVQTFQTGYRYKNRPLREAMVIVAK